jgi:hypothetical protein
MVVNTINNEFEQECLDEALWLLNAGAIRQSTGDSLPACKISIRCRPGRKFLRYQVWAISFIVRRWVWDAALPGALVADEMGHGKTFTSDAMTMLCQLMTANVVIGLPLSILCGNTLDEWVVLAHSDFPGIVSEEREWYPLQRLNSVPRRLLEVQLIPPHWHPALISAPQSIIVATMPRVAEMFRIAIDEMMH